MATWPGPLADDLWHHGGMVPVSPDLWLKIGMFWTVSPVSPVSPWLFAWNSWSKISVPFTSCTRKVNPGWIAKNHGLWQLGGYSSNSHFIWYLNGIPPIEEPFGFINPGLTLLKAIQWCYGSDMNLAWQMKLQEETERIVQCNGCLPVLPVYLVYWKSWHPMISPSETYGFYQCMLKSHHIP